uniref:Uncharacterized protein n=1 Tax=Cannabis sativa TaxID=3483 RepID=A0A803QCV2_CANSA
MPSLSLIFFLRISSSHISNPRNHQDPAFQPSAFPSRSFSLPRNSYQNKRPKFLPLVTVAISQGDLDFEILAQKACKSKIPQDPTVTFEVELMESKVRSIGSYVEEVLRIANQYGTNFDSAGHPNWDMSSLNPFDLFMITDSTKFSNYYSFSSSSDDNDMDFEYLLSSPLGSKKGKK